MASLALTVLSETFREWKVFENAAFSLFKAISRFTCVILLKSKNAKVRINMENFHPWLKYRSELLTFEKAKIACKVRLSKLFACLYLCWGLSFSPRAHGKGGASTGGGACRLGPPFWSPGRHCVTIVTTHLLISTIRIRIHLSRAAWVCSRPWAKDTARKKQTRKILK